MPTELAPYQLLEEAKMGQDKIKLNTVMQIAKFVLKKKLVRQHWFCNSFKMATSTSLGYSHSLALHLPLFVVCYIQNTHTHLHIYTYIYTYIRMSEISQRNN